MIIEVVFVAETKTCVMCKKDLPASEYYAFRRNRDGLASYCKSCMKSHVMEWQRANRERRNAQVRARRAEQPERHRQYNRDRRARLKAMPENKNKCSKCIVSRHKRCTGRRLGGVCECKCKQKNTVQSASQLEISA